MEIRCKYCIELYDEALDLCPYCGYMDGDAAKEPYFLAPGTVLHERYVVGKVLGFGGFGITYKAWDKNLAAVVVVKEYYYAGVVNRQPETQEVLIYAVNRKLEYQHFLKRFIDEARYVAKFNNNSNIVNVFDYFEANNTAYMVMEFLDGITLSEHIKRNRMSIDECIEVMRGLCAALKTVHENRIIHRDISPDNIYMCKNGKVKLIDFGAARFSKHEEQQLAKLTQVVKPGFSPPEQYQSVSLQGPWTDIYALGASLYYMITGQKPIESTNRKTEDNLIPPEKLNDDIPKYINDTILRAMAVDTHLRFNNVTEFEKALTKGKKVRSVAKERGRRRRNRWFSAVAAILVVGAAFAYFLYNYYQMMYEETLPDSEIELWYVLYGDDEEDWEAKTNALESIIDVFNESFANVVIKLQPYNEDEYVDAIKNAYNSGALPHLFESTFINDDMLDKVNIVNNAMRWVNADEAVLIESYFNSRQDVKRFPLGFIMPVIYANTTVINSSISETDDLIDFLEGRAQSYLGDSSDYYAVQAALPARYTLSKADDDTVECRFSFLFSIGDCDKGQMQTAERLLAYLLSEMAQDYLHIQHHSGALPLNIASLDEYTAIYDEFTGLFDNIGMFTVK